MVRTAEQVARRSKYFDWFVLAGLAMNVAIVTYLVGYWLLH